MRWPISIMTSWLPVQAQLRFGTHKAGCMPLLSPTDIVMLLPLDDYLLDEV
jgi:hypothetical protein